MPFIPEPDAEGFVEQLAHIERASYGVCDYYKEPVLRLTVLMYGGYNSDLVVSQPDANVEIQKSQVEDVTRLAGKPCVIAYNHETRIILFRRLGAT